MTIQASSAKDHPLYDANVIPEILEFIGGEKNSASTSRQTQLDFARAAIGLAGTPIASQGWNQTSKMMNLRKQILDQSLKRFEKYCQPEILELFQKQGFPIESLPFLDIGKVFEQVKRPSDGKYRDYPDFLKPEDLTYPLMRFEDPWGRHGIAIHYRSKDGKKNEIVCIFQRYKNLKVTWLAFNKNSNLCKDAHLIEEAKTYKEINQDNFTALTQLLSNTHSKWEIAFKAPSKIPNALRIGAIAIAILAVLVEYLANQE